MQGISRKRQEISGSLVGAPRPCGAGAVRLTRLQRAGMAHCAPKLNAKGDPNKWLSDKQAPWKKLANEKPKGETIAYQTLLDAWKAGKVR